MRTAARALIEQAVFFVECQDASSFDLERVLDQRAAAFERVDVEPALLNGDIEHPSGEFQIHVDLSDRPAAAADAKSDKSKGKLDEEKEKKAEKGNPHSDEDAEERKSQGDTTADKLETRKNYADWKESATEKQMLEDANDAPSEFDKHEFNTESYMESQFEKAVAKEPKVQLIVFFSCEGGGAVRFVLRCICILHGPDLLSQSFIIPSCIACEQRNDHRTDPCAWRSASATTANIWLTAASV